MAKTADDIILGNKVIDQITGFEGHATTRLTYISGCIQFGVQPKVGADGKRPDAEFFDFDVLAVVDKGHAPDEPKPYVDARVKLGARVRDTASGLEGVATGIIHHINGCAQVAIQPKMATDGKWVEAKWIDFQRIETMPDPGIAPPSRPHGGPTTDAPSGNYRG